MDFSRRFAFFESLPDSKKKELEENVEKLRALGAQFVTVYDLLETSI